MNQTWTHELKVLRSCLAGRFQDQIEASLNLRTGEQQDLSLEQTDHAATTRSAAFARTTWFA